MVDAEGTYWFDDVRLVTMHNETFTSYTAWAAAQAVTDSAANTAPNHTLPNLIRYAFETEIDQSGLPLCQLTTASGSSSERWLELILKRKTYAPNLRYLVQGSNDLVQWQTLATVLPANPETWTYCEAVTAACRFLRVKVEQLP